MSGTALKSGASDRAASAVAPPADTILLQQSSDPPEAALVVLRPDVAEMQPNRRGRREVRLAVEGLEEFAAVVAARWHPSWQLVWPNGPITDETTVRLILVRCHGIEPFWPCDLTDGSACSRHLRSRLPAAFRRAWCWWRCQAWHGLPGTSGVWQDLAFMLGQPVSLRVLERLFEDSPAKAEDFRAGATVPLGAPTFGEIPDPIPRRCGLLRDGEPIVRLRARACGRPAASDPGGRRRYGQAALRREGEQVRRAAGTRREPRLRQAARNLARLVAEGLLRRSDLEAELLVTALASGLARRSAEAAIASGIEAGLAASRPRAGSND